MSWQTFWAFHGVVAAVAFALHMFYHRRLFEWEDVMLGAIGALMPVLNVLFAGMTAFLIYDEERELRKKGRGK